MKAILGEYHAYVSWTYTLNPKTKKQKETNANLMALFGDIGRMVVKSMKKKQHKNSA